MRAIGRRVFRSNVALGLVAVVLTVGSVVGPVVVLHHIDEKECGRG